MAGDAVAKAKEWPKTPSALSGRLRRAATFLRKVGMVVEFTREEKARTRTITLSLADETGKSPSAASAPSAEVGGASVDNDLAACGRRTADGAADGPDAAADGPECRADAPADGAGGSADGDAAESIRPNPLKENTTDGTDGADGDPRSFSAAEEMWEADL